MSEIVEYAEALAEDIKTALVTADIKAVSTANVRQASPPAVLVSPIPRREYDDLASGFEAVWSVYCIASGIGDLTDARTLDQLLSVVMPIVDPLGHDITAEPVSYVLPSGTDAKPAYLIQFTNHVHP